MRQIILSLLRLTTVASLFLDNGVHELTDLPTGWSFHSNAKHYEPLRLRISLRHPNEEYLDIARQVSDPESDSYGQYLSSEQLQVALPNVEDAAASIKTWLKSKDVTEFGRRRDWVDFNTTVSEAGILLNANFSWYSQRGEEPNLRTLAYSIPTQLKKNIDFVFPTIHFLNFAQRRRSLQRRQHLPPANPNCTNSICPQQIKDAYQIDHVPLDTYVTSPSRVGITRFLEQYANHADLQSFLKRFGLTGHRIPYDFQ